MDAECVSCLTVFASAPADDTLVAFICEHAPDCQCEPQVVSEHCSAPISDDELLVRLVVDDVHITRADDGRVELRESFLSDIHTYGSSTLRLGRATVAEFQNQVAEILGAGKLKADGSPREIIGYVTIPVHVVRGILAKIKKAKPQDPDVFTRACAAYATGLSNVPNHADLMLNDVGKMSSGGRIAAMKGVGSAVRNNFVVVNSVDEILALGVLN